MKKITLEDCRNLKKFFDDYCETAEQHEFISLLLVGTKLDKTLECVEEFGVSDSIQDELNAMFRVVLTAIGMDASDYAEED